MLIKLTDKVMDNVYASCDKIDSLREDIEKAMNETPSENLKGEIKPLWDSLVQEIDYITAFIEKI